MKTASRIPIYIINLDRDADRWNSIQAVMEKFGLPYHRFSAIDGKNKLPLIRSVISRDFVNTKLGRPQTSGEICCSLSHLAVLRKLVRSKISRAIILEDDAELSSDFLKFYQEELPFYLNVCDVVKIEGIFYDNTSVSGPLLAKRTLTKMIVPPVPTLGSAGYAVNSRGARSLLHRIAQCDWPMDHMLVGYEGYSATFGEIRPMLVQQAASSSNIELDRRKELDGFNKDRGTWASGLRRRIAWAVRGIRRPYALARNLIVGWYRSTVNLIIARR